MNITPLYELSSRLRNCMIAGTNLVMEDFRLRRAVEDIKPYAKAAPVFAKLAELTGQLLEPDRDDREELLLDAITLLDALLCTQAMVRADEPVPAGSRAGKKTSTAWRYIQREKYTVFTALPTH